MESPSQTRKVSIYAIYSDAGLFKVGIAYILYARNAII